MHLDFVEMGDDVKLFIFDHFVRLFEESTHGTADVAIKELLQAFIVDFPFRAIDEEPVEGPD